MCLAEITGSDKASGIQNGEIRESERACVRVNTGPGTTQKHHCQLMPALSCRKKSCFTHLALEMENERTVRFAHFFGVKLLSEHFPLPVHKSRIYNFVQKGFREKNWCLTDK